MLTKDAEATAVATPPMKSDSAPEGRRDEDLGDEIAPDLHRRRIFRPGRRQDLGLRSRSSLRRRHFRRHSFLQRPRLPDGGAHRIGSGIRPARSASRFRSRAQEMDEALLETIRQNDLRDGYVRLIVTRGVGNLGLNPAQCKRPSVIIIATTIALYSEEMYRARPDGRDRADAPDGSGDSESRRSSRSIISTTSSPGSKRTWRTPMKRSC